MIVEPRADTGGSLDSRPNTPEITPSIEYGIDFVN
jgi:hypothetical protein